MLIAVCFTFTAVWQPDSSAETDTVVISTDGIVTETSTVTEAVLAYEKVSAEKKGYESMGMNVIVTGHAPDGGDRFMNGLVDKMQDMVGMQPMDGPGCPLGEHHAENTVTVTYETEVSVDTEFLEEVIEFIEESDDAPEDDTVEELNEELDMQTEYLNKLLLAKSVDETIIADSTSRNCSRDSEPEDQEIPDTEDIAIVEDDDGAAQRRSHRCQRTHAHGRRNVRHNHRSARFQRGLRRFLPVHVLDRRCRSGDDSEDDPDDTTVTDDSSGSDNTLFFGIAAAVIVAGLIIGVLYIHEARKI